MNDKFGDLRSLAQRPASPSAWGDLLHRAQQLESNGELTPAMMAYLEERARRFPNAMRILPPKWTRQLCSKTNSRVLSLCCHLKLKKRNIDAQAGAALRACEHLHSAQTLQITNTHADFLGIMGLVQAPWFERLTSLELYQCDLTRAAWEALAHHMPPMLRQLHVTNCAPPATAWRGLLDGAFLEDVALERSRHGQALELSEGLESLSASGQLRSLVLTGASANRAAMRGLLEASHPHLHTLRLKWLSVGTLNAPARIPIQDIERLWNNASLTELARVELAGMRVLGQGLELGAGATWCPEHLDLRSTQWEDERAWASLGTHEHLDRVRHLDVNHCETRLISDLLCAKGWDGLEILDARCVELEAHVERALSDPSRFPALRHVASREFEM